MNVSTLGRFLIGNREAILRIANCRHALWIGLLFVLSAGLAREYDGVDLTYEPWIALVPIAASLGTSFVLYMLVRIVVPWPKLPEAPMPFWSWYLKFLGLYWATAPLAWLYAIPVERFMTAGNATRANFLFLAIVSVWRVSLITRVISVVWNISAGSAFWVVMLFADSVALVALTFTPKPIFDVMGGVRLSEREVFIQGAICLVGTAAVLSWLVWLIGTAEVGFRLHSTPPESQPAEPATPRWSASRGLWFAAIFSVLVWACILPFTQPEQINRRIVERQLSDGKISESLVFLSQHSRRDFPPLWDPPPQLGYGETKPGLLDVLEIVASPDVPPALREVFTDKLMTQFRRYDRDSWYYGPKFFRVIDSPEGELARFVRSLQSIPEGPQIAYFYRLGAEDGLRSKKERYYAVDEGTDVPPLTPRRKELLNSLHALSDGIAADRPKAEQD